MRHLSIIFPSFVLGENLRNFLGPFGIFFNYWIASIWWKRTEFFSEKFSICCSTFCGFRGIKIPKIPPSPDRLSWGKGQWILCLFFFLNSVFIKFFIKNLDDVNFSPAKILGTGLLKKIIAKILSFYYEETPSLLRFLFKHPRKIHKIFFENLFLI